MGYFPALLKKSVNFSLLQSETQMKKIVLPDNQLNQLVSRVTEGLLAGASFPNGFVTGEEVLTFAKHQQVNKFVLFQIYQDWSAHMQKMAHPFFNYNHPEVVKGLKTFQNIISDHIQVPVADFKKLLQQAVYNSLKLILNPEDAIGNFFFRDTTAIPTEIYEKHAPYFKDFDFVILALQRYFQKNEAKRIEKKVYFEKFAKVIEVYESRNKLGPEDYQRNLFKSLTGQDMEQFLRQAAQEAAKEPVKRRVPPPVLPKTSANPPQSNPNQPPSAESKPQTISESFRNQEAEKGKSLNEAFANRDKSGQSVNERNQQEGKEVEEPEMPKRRVPSLLQPSRKDKAEPPKDDTAPESDESADGKKSTIDLFAQKKKQESQLKEKRTIADSLANSNDGKTINEQMGEAKTIRTDQIPVHKQFQFVQKVFGGSSVKFKVVLDKINKTETIEEAESVLDRYVFNDPAVNRNDKVCQEFESLVRNRFQANWDE